LRLRGDETDAGFREDEGAARFVLLSVEALVTGLEGGVVSLKANC